MNDLAPGAVLWQYDFPLTSVEAVAYAGATWDWHKLHHDQAYVETIGLDRPVIDGQMFGGIFAGDAHRAAGEGYRVSELSIRFRSMVFVGDTATIEVKVISVSNGIELEHTATVGDTVCVTGTSKAVRI